MKKLVMIMTLVSLMNVQPAQALELHPIKAVKNVVSTTLGVTKKLVDTAMGLVSLTARATTVTVSELADTTEDLGNGLLDSGNMLIAP